jgi:radical SAM superfamily enzyme YgiQ (UPF0313 family)
MVRSLEAAPKEIMMNILMIYPKFPDQTFWNTSRTGELFVHRRGIMPPLGLLTIASYLPHDFRVRLIDRNVREESADDWEWADVVLVSMMVTQLADYRACVDKARLHGKPIAVGGPFTHAMPEVAIADAEWVCFGEAEAVMDEFVSDLRAGRRAKQYQGGNTTNMQSVPLPRFDLLPNLNAYCSMAIQFSRGCPFRCEFCDIIEIYGRVPRTKTPPQILAELTALQQLGYQGYVFLVDDNFIGNKKNAKLMLKEIAMWNHDHDYPFRFYTEASINLADDEELLAAMSHANFLHVFIGIETPDPALLKTTLKVQNIPGNPLDKLRKVREHGVHITAGFILGFDGETRGVFEAQRAFIQASGIGIAMTGLLQAIPHTQLYRRLKHEGRLLENASLRVNTTVEGLNFIPKGEMTKREYLQRYQELVQEIYGAQAYFERIMPALLTLRNITPRRVISRQWRRYFRILLRLFYHLGLRASGARRYFWKTFFQVLRKNPAALEAWGYDCFYFHHLNQHANYIQRALSSYLASPASDDVLDEVVQASESVNAAG